MDLSTLPNKPIQANDLYKKPDEVQGEVNYIDKVGTGYGWILILIGMAIFSIIFYVYFVWSIMTLNSFNFNTTPGLRFGSGQAKVSCKEIINKLGSRILFITDKGLMSLGLTKPTIDELKKKVLLKYSIMLKLILLKKLF